MEERSVMRVQRREDEEKLIAGTLAARPDYRWRGVSVVSIKIRLEVTIGRITRAFRDCKKRRRDLKEREDTEVCGRCSPRSTA